MHDLCNVKTIDELEKLEKGDLADRSSKIIDSINRAIDYILVSGATNTVTAEIDAYDEKEEKKYIKVSLKEIANNIFRINKVNYESEGGQIETEVDYRYEGDENIVLPNRKSGKGVYIVVYTKDIARYTNSSPNNVEIPLKSELVRLIPYFVKGELYEEDEPNLAIQAQNMFVAGINNVIASRPAEQTRLDVVYGGDW